MTDTPDDLLASLLDRLNREFESDRGDDASRQSRQRYSIRSKVCAPTSLASSVPSSSGYSFFSVIEHDGPGATMSLPARTSAARWATL